MITWALAGVLWAMAPSDLAAGVSALDAGRIEEAVQILSAVVEKYPANSEAHRFLALAHLRAGRSAEAHKSAKRAVQQSQSSAAAWKTLAMVIATGGRIEDSVVPFGKACDLSPEDADACYYLARALYASGSYDEARMRFEHVMRMPESRSSARVQRAAALNFAALGKAADAERHFLEAIRLDETRTRPEEDPRIDYGAFLVRQGRAEEALDPLENAVKASANSVRAHVELGRALLHLNRLQPSVLHLEKAVELDPKNWSARLLLGKAYLQSGRRTEGERQVRLGREGWSKQPQGSSNLK
jgi:protein O-GlcNAc transferase